ncbi:amidohydrolase family protein [Ramlibacter algicola]|uniref:Amidohydrolase family protein n=1 Tax=Ramlibacter algicola TaxID=2795217 RepID=A0A934UQX1_9BURK|nr:amidohydrolase family protein [Ramlibacter algicola]MBK0393129.1 amidohydrolase family protein [Ramlibacter algicola]
MPRAHRALLALAAALAFAPVCAQEARPAPPLPIADVHFHLMLFMTPADLKEHMDRHNIRWTLSAGAVGNPGVASPATRDAAVRQLLGERFIPATGASETYLAERRIGPRFYSDEPGPEREEALGRIDTQMAAPPRMLAETFPNAETSSADPLRRRRVATDGPFFRRLMAIAVREKRPVPMHMQWHPDSVAQLSQLLQDHPGGQVLLSHCGKDTTAADIRTMLDKHPNLFCDLSFRGAPLALQESQKDPNRLVFWGPGLLQAAGIRPEWRQLIEDHSDRFMVGIDDVHSWGVYDDTVAAIREGVLAKLTPATAEKVAWRNAERLFRLPPVEAPAAAN